MNINFNFLVVQLALAQHFAEFLARFAVVLLDRGIVAKADRLHRWWQQRIEYALFSSIFGAVPEFAHRIFANHLDSNVHQVAHNTVDFTTDVADLGELGGFDLDKRCFRQPCQSS